MTRDDMNERYENDAGEIVSPGKFQGEPVWAPHVWEGVLEGCIEGEFDDKEGNHVFVYYPTGDDAAQYPEIVGIACIYLWEGEEGFIYTQLFHQIPNWEGGKQK